MVNYGKYKQTMNVSIEDMKEYFNSKYKGFDKEDYIIIQYYCENGDNDWSFNLFWKDFDNNKKGKILNINSSSPFAFSMSKWCWEDED
jgi:hypothetical protein